MKFHLFYLTCFFIICIGCEKELDTRSLTLDAGKANVSCYITDTKNKIYLYLNKPLSIGETYNFFSFNLGNSSIPDAKVFLENANEKRQLLYNDTIKGYKCDTTGLSIVKGNFFKLNITLNDGTELNSFLTIPTFNNVNYTNTFNYVAHSHYDYTININNSSHEDKFIMFELQRPFFFGNNDTMYSFLETIPVKIAASQNVITISETKSLSFALSLGVSIPSYPLYIKNYTITEDLYNYLVSVNNNLSSGNDPNTEPSPIFSNIDGAIGIFGAAMK